MTFIFEAKIDKDHPSLAGHFPGNPIVPGVVLLDQVRIALSQWQPEFVVISLPQVKFHLPLLPEQSFTVHLQEKAGKFNFSCKQGDTLLAQGSLTLEKRK